MKYSVIIPIYQAEKTIQKCLDSLLEQPHENAEILLINDGSPDGSGEICRRYAERFPYIRYFAKENGGVSSARNLGLREARGDYILFVDSDDYVSPKYFFQIGMALETSAPDMLIFAIQDLNRKRSVWSTDDYISVGDAAIAKKSYKAVRSYLFSNVLSKVFVRKIIQENGLQFNEAVSIGEDQAFVFAYTLHVKKMVSISDVLYFYTGGNANSLSLKRREYLSEQLLLVSQEMLSTLVTSQLSDRARIQYHEALIWTHYRSAYSSCKELLKFDLTYAQRSRKIRYICQIYSTEHFRPRRWNAWIISFPIVHRLIFLIDMLVKCAYYHRRTWL